MQQLTEIALEKLSVAYNKTVGWIEVKSQHQEAALEVFLTDTVASLAKIQAYYSLLG